MGATETAKVTYRKAKTGEWVAFGPVDVVTVGFVTVAKRDGSTKIENVGSVGKAFSVNGVECRYGYLSPAKPKPATARTSGTRRPSRTHRHACDECGEFAAAGTQCWETGFIH